jgi:hypothetical protein
MAEVVKMRSRKVVQGPGRGYWGRSRWRSDPQFFSWGASEVLGWEGLSAPWK